MSRRIQRKDAVLLAYEMEINKEEELSYLNDFFNKKGKSIEDNEYSYLVLKNLFENREIILKAIERGSQKWKLERISKMDLAILKVAVAEMFFVDEVPLGVSINEAVEISKAYSGEYSYKFINGVLRHVNDTIGSMADMEESYLELLTAEYNKEVTLELEKERLRLEEIELIKKRLAEIRAIKEQKETEEKEAQRLTLENADDDIVFLDID